MNTVERTELNVHLADKFLHWFFLFATPAFLGCICRGLLLLVRALRLLGSGLGGLLLWLLLLAAAVAVATEVLLSSSLLDSFFAGAFFTGAFFAATFVDAFFFTFSPWLLLSSLLLLS